MSKHSIKIRITFALIVPVCALFALGCASKVERPSPANSGETREVVDEAGKRLRVPSRPQRIITLAPNLTEIVYAIGAGNRLVGNTTYCDYPEEARGVAKIGDTLQPNIERIIALKPDVILVSTASQLETFTKQLDERRIPVFITNPHDLEGIFHSIKTLGDLLGQQAEAEKLIESLRARVSSVEAAVKGRTPLRVFYQVSAEPLWTAGRLSWITDLIRRAGGQSVTAEVEGEWMRYSDEAALAARPEAIIMATGQEKMKVAAALEKSPAVLSNRVYEISGDYLSRPGPRLVEGLEQLARALHPEAFR